MWYKLKTSYSKRLQLLHAYMRIRLMSKGSSHFPQFHTIEHIVLHTVNFAVPALMEVAIKPLPEGMAFGIEIGIEVVHYLAFAFYILQQVFVTYRPGL